MSTNKAFPALELFMNNPPFAHKFTIPSCTYQGENGGRKKSGAQLSAAILPVLSLPSASAFTLTRLHRFTLAYFGSHAPLPTLTSRLAALTPRLCTGCLLRFPGIGLSPIYVMCAELAHRFFCLIASLLGRFPTLTLR